MLSGKAKDYLENERAKGKSATEVIEQLIENQVTFDGQLNMISADLHKLLQDRYNSPEIAHIAYQVRDSIRKMESGPNARILLIDTLGKYVCTSIEDKGGA